MRGQSSPASLHQRRGAGKGGGGAQRLNLTRYRSLNYSSVVRKISIRATCVDAIRDLIFLSFLQKDCKFVKIFDKIKHQTETPAIFFPQHFICWKRCLALFLFLWRKLKTYLFLAFASFSFGEKKNMQICLFVIFFFLVSGVKFVIATRQQESQKKEKWEMGGRLGLQSVGCYLSCEWDSIIMMWKWCWKRKVGQTGAYLVRMALCLPSPISITNVSITITK